MKCVNCFEEIPENAVFCHLCGVKQTTSDIEEQIDFIEDKLAITGCSFNEKGRIDCKQWIKEFGFNEVSEAVDISLKQYLKFDVNDNPIRETADMVFNKIAGICANRKMSKDKPYYADMCKMLGYANKKFYLSNRQEQEYKECIQRLLYLFYDKATDYSNMFEDLFWKLKKANDKWEFIDEVRELIELWEADH